MAQITLYLNDELQAKLRAAAEATNLSQSRWVANLTSEKLHSEWPASIIALNGAWPDLPEAETLRQEMGEDVVRESLS